jgi:hypothetical protein
MVAAIAPTNASIGATMPTEHHMINAQPRKPRCLPDQPVAGACVADRPRRIGAHLMGPAVEALTVAGPPFSIPVGSGRSAPAAGAERNADGDALVSQH